MTPEQKLDKAAQSFGWTSWAEVISHNAPAHVINRVVMLAMGENPNMDTRFSDADELRQFADQLRNGEPEPLCRVEIAMKTYPMP